MPNWCINTIEINGSVEDIKRFRESMRGRSPAYNKYLSESIESGTEFCEIKKAHYATPPDNNNPIQDFSLNALCPVPDDIMRFPYDCNQASKAREEIGAEQDHGGYTWQVNNWGVKWDIDPEVDFGENYITLEFDSPWGPPLEAVEKMSSMYKDMSFLITYDESGCELHGSDLYEGGVHCNHENLNPICGECGERPPECECVRCVHCDETEDWCECESEGTK